MESSVYLSPIAIECDSPPYNIVKASAQVGLRTPEDVRWCRKPSPPRKAPAGWSALPGRIWKLLFAFGLPEGEEECVCGRLVTERFPVLFRSQSGAEACYTLTQCDNCRTILWDFLPDGHSDHVES
jgi:hypothetical protein